MAAKSDKLFQNSRAKTGFSRKKPHKPQYDRILIVCGDEVTEPHYFEAMRSDLGLTNAKVKVCGKECGDKPSDVYDYAVKELKNSLKKSNEYTRVYCVFDKDTHACYDKTLLKIKNAKTRKIIAAHSVPCFEFWVLLHFTKTAREFKTRREVEKDLKKYIANYSHDQTRNLYPHIKSKTNAAIKNSEWVLKEIKKLGKNNPSTHIHILIEDLLKQSETHTKS